MTLYMMIVDAGDIMCCNMTGTHGYTWIHDCYAICIYKYCKYFCLNNEILFRFPSSKLVSTFKTCLAITACTNIQRMFTVY